MVLYTLMAVFTVALVSSGVCLFTDRGDDYCCGVFSASLVGCLVTMVIYLTSLYFGGVS